MNEVTRDVWDISDIEQEAQHWTLSSDVNMLQFLQTFSENLTSKLNSTSESLEQLICFTEVILCRYSCKRNDLTVQWFLYRIKDYHVFVVIMEYSRVL